MSIFGSFWKKNSEHSPKPGKWQVGDKIGGCYEVRQILGGAGKTGMGIVYACVEPSNKYIYALKTFQENFFPSSEHQSLFKREALAWIKLASHPNIVYAFSAQLLENRLFIILEYINPDAYGRNTLSHYLGKLTFEEMLKISIQFCHGMEYAYSKGIDAHRDIKPDNIMITADKTVKITDFGLVKAFQEIEFKENFISRNEKHSLSIFKSKGKQICGTLPYMSPEQFDGYADARSDVYSFGVTLYQLISGGRLPFFGKNFEDYEKLHKYRNIDLIKSPLFYIVQKCLEKDPDKRYQSFSIIREELQNLFPEQAGRAAKPSTMRNSEDFQLIREAETLYSIGKYEDAIRCIDKAINLNTIWNSSKAEMLTRLGRYQESIDCYDKILSFDPKNSIAWFDKGASLMRLARYQEALQCLNEALRINPGLTFVQNERINCLKKLGR
ncbi:MAG: serine/threonine-protein kinase [Candidatus Omnitrophota bacterium]